MQRRAAAAYIVLFLVIAAGSYAVIATSQPPEVTMDAGDARYTLGQGDQLTVDGRTYTVQSISAGSSAELAWVNESAIHTATWENGSTQTNVTVGGQTYNGSFVVQVESAEDPTSVTLREEVEAETRELDGQTYVFRDADGDGEADPDELIPIGEYIQQEVAAGNLTQFTVEEGQTNYAGNQATVTITNESVEFTWRAPRTNTVTARQAANVTLNGQQFFGFFTSGSQISLFDTPEGFQTYQEEVESADYFHERTNGLWGILILSLLSALFLVALAFLPHKDT